MACRMLEAGSMLCFGVQRYTDNIVYGEPFESHSFLSYFNQTAQISIVGNSQNFSYSDTLDLDVTLGQPTISGEFPNVTGEGIHITSNATQLGVQAVVDIGGMPERLGLIQFLNVTNLGTDNDTIEIDLQGLPEDWSGVFIYGGAIVKNISVPVNESREVLLHVQMPSYMLEVQLNYFIPMKGADEPKAEYLFEKEMLYPNDLVEVFVFLLRDDDLVLEENLFQLTDPVWHPTYELMWHRAGVLNLGPSERIGLTVSWENPTDYSLIALGVFAAVLASLIVFLVIRRKRAVVPKKELGEEHEAEIPAKPVPTDLEGKKKQILLAIKRLNEDFEAGNVPEDVYNDLVAQYKKSAIEVMKEIDGGK